ncbi:MAG: hypothetical protein M3321_09460 [Actinomycetota bacterium]|nr:hypothetical protein [Actinomycetota bacterium]
MSNEPWAPDSRRFVYEACRVRCVAIAVRDSAGRGRPLYLTRPAKSESPTWSPRGTHIAFVGGGDTDAAPPISANVYVVSSDGSGRANVSRARSRRLFFDADGRELSWSPDGRWLVFSAASAGRPDGPSALWVVRRDGTDFRPLLRGAARVGADDHAPAWSPDGRRIAFARIVGAEDEDAPLSSSIYTVAPNGSGLRRLTR